VTSLNETTIPSRSAVPKPELPPDLVHSACVVDTALEGLIDCLELPANLVEAIRHGVVGGGKRTRPALVLRCCEAVGGDQEAALPAAMAIELVHCFSLVHDDLPAMDDDDLRRGRPTVHVAYGEAMAILAGDAMMSLAFELLGRDAPRAAAQPLVRELSEATTAMIAGQVYDTLGGFADGADDAERLDMIHRNKTGALLRASCRMGAICGQASAAELDALTRYGDAIGLMFQIVDDLLDVEQTAEHTGKRTGKDVGAGKMTWPAVSGAEASREMVERLRLQGREAIESLAEAASPLRALCDFLAIRTK